MVLWIGNGFHIKYKHQLWLSALTRKEREVQEEVSECGREVRMSNGH